MSLESSDERLQALLTAFSHYMQARRILLNHLQLPYSGRDPLAEFSEIIVNTLVQGAVAPSRTQKGYDIITKEGRYLQVKYLFNPKVPWINEHAILFAEGVDEYALVIYEEMVLQSILVFSRETLEQVYQLLGKRHPNPKTTLFLTRKNYRTIVSNIEAFQQLKVRVYRFSNTEEIDSI